MLLLFLTFLSIFLFGLIVSYLYSKTYKIVRALVPFAFKFTSTSYNWNIVHITIIQFYSYYFPEGKVGTGVFQHPPQSSFKKVDNAHLKTLKCSQIANGKAKRGSSSKMPICLKWKISSINDSPTSHSSKASWPLPGSGLDLLLFLCPLIF